MAAKKRTNAQALEDYPIIAALFFQGKTQKEIAATISKMRTYSITQQTVSNDIKALEKVWKDSAAIDINTEKGKLKMHYEALIAEHYKAWERSQKDAVTHTTGKTPKGTIDTIQRQGQTGDARFLAEIRNLLSEYAELFGIRPAKQLDIELTKPPEFIEVERTIEK